MKSRLKLIKKSVHEMNSYEFVQFPCKVKLNQNESPFDIPDDIKLKILEDFQKVKWAQYPPLYPVELIKSLG